MATPAALVLGEFSSQAAVTNADYAGDVLRHLVLVLQRADSDPESDCVAKALPLTAAVRALMALHGSSALVCRWGCRSLTLLASYDGVACADLVAAAIQALHEHPETAEVAFEALVAAERLARANSVCADAAVAAHAIDAAVAAMLAHPGHRFVRIMGCDLISTLLHDSSSAAAVLAAREARASDAVLAVSGVLRTHLSGAVNVCEALAIMTDHGILNDDATGAAEAGRCVASVVLALETQHSFEFLQIAAYALRSFLRAKLTTAIAGFEDGNGVEALCSVLCAHARVSGESFETAIIALRMVLQRERDNNSKCVLRAADAGAFGALAEVLQQSGPAASSLGLITSMHCVCLLLEVPGTAMHAGQVRVLEAVVAAMLRAPKDAKLQKDGAWALHVAATHNGIFVGADADRTAVIRALLDAMRTHRSDTSTLYSCLVATASVCLEDDFERIAGSLGAHAVVVDVFTTCIDHEEVIHAALNTLRNTSLLDENKDIAGSCGSVEAAVRVLVRYADSERIAMGACGALAPLVSTTANEAAACRCGALPAIVAALRTYGRSCKALTTYACVALARATVLAENEKAAGDAGAVATLVAVLEDHAAETDALSHALWALRNLAISGPNKKRIVSAKVVPAVVKVMQRNPADADVQEAGCHLFVYACCNNPEGDKSAAVACCAESAKAGAHIAVATAMLAHPLEHKLNALAVRALCEMMHNNDLLRSCAATDDEAAVPKAVIDAMERYVDDAELVQFGSTTLAFMFVPLDVAACSSLPPLPPSIALSIVAMLQRYGSVDTICVPFMSMLLPVVSLVEHANARRALLDADLATVAIHVICQHASGGIAREVAMRFLFMLLQDDAVVLRRVIACGLPKLLRKMMRDGATNRLSPVEATVMKELRVKLAALEDAHGPTCAEADCALCGMHPGRCGSTSCSIHAGVDVTLKRCAACKTAAYCCAAHQRDAWTKHKPVCRARVAVQAALAALT